MSKDLRITYLDEGKGEVIVLLHGFCESAMVFRNLIAGLSGSMRVVAPDLPGFGGSEREEGLGSIDGLAFWLRDFLDSLKIDRFYLLGHSMGGYAACGFAAFYPERLKGLILLHSTSLADLPEKKDNRQKSIDFIAKNGKEPFLKVFIPSLFLKPTDEWQNEIWKISQGLMPQTIIQYTKIMMNRPERLEVIKNLKCPVMYILGEKDELVPFDRSMKEVADAGVVMLHRIPDCAHMSMYETPKALLKAVSNLVAVHPSKS